jgi:hypothetical protein
LPSGMKVTRTSLSGGMLVVFASLIAASLISGSGTGE